MLWVWLSPVKEQQYLKGGEAGRKSSFCVIVLRDDTTAVLETREEK